MLGCGGEHGCSVRAVPFAVGTVGPAGPRALISGYNGSRSGTLLCKIAPIRAIAGISRIYYGGRGDLVSCY